MAIQYNISGKTDTSAITKTELALKKMGNTVSSINKLAAGFVITKVMQGVAKVTNGATESFLQQNKALAQYNNTLTRLGKNLNAFNSIRKDVSHNNLFDDDTLNNALKYCAQLGLTEEQTRKVMKASTDMAAGGIMPLDQAVKSLSLTYSGQIGQLKRIQPELSNLTTEQLKQGKAVDYISEKYKGMASTIAETFDGRNTQWNNSFSDLQSSIGSIFQKVKFLQQGEWLEPLNKITDWFNKNSDKISAWIATIPQNIKSIWNVVKSLLEEVFSTKFWEDNGEVIGTILTNVFSSLGKTSINISIATLSSIIDLVKNVAPSIGAGFLSGVKDGLGSVGQWFIELLMGTVGGNEKLIAAWNAVEDWKTKDRAIDNWKEDFDKGLIEAAKDINSNFSTSFGEIKSSWQNSSKVLSAQIKKIDSTIDEKITDANNEIKNNVAEKLVSIEKAVENVDAGSGNSTNIVTETTKGIIIENANNSNLTPGKIFSHNLATLLDRFIQIGIINFSNKAISDNENLDFASEEDKKIWQDKQIEKLNRYKSYMTKSSEIFSNASEHSPVGLFKDIIPAYLKAITGMDVNTKGGFLENVFKNMLKPVAAAFDEGDKWLFNKVGNFFSSVETDFTELCVATRTTIKTVTTGLMKDLFGSVSSTLFENMGNLSQYIKAGKEGFKTAGVEGAVLGVGVMLLQSLLAKVEEISAKVEFVFNSVDTILDLIVSNFVPLIEDFIQPFIDTFAAVKEVITSILSFFGSVVSVITIIAQYISQFINILSPALVSIFGCLSKFIELIGALIQMLHPFIWLVEQIMKIIATAVTWVSNLLSNILTAIYNAVIAVYNFLVTKKNEKAYKDYVSLSSGISEIWNGYSQAEVNSLVAAAVAQGASSTVTGSSASYTAARDIYLTINYEHSYVNGDAREIAMNLYDEIQNCKKLNLIG